MTGNDETSPALQGRHPAADELAGFAEGTLAFEDDEQIRRHLEVCAECHGLVRDLSTYPSLEPPDETYRVNEEELRTTLGALRARVLDSLSSDPARAVTVEVAESQPREPRNEPVARPPASDRPATLTPSPSQPPDKAYQRRRWRPLLAAAVVLLGLGWGWQRGSESKRLLAEVATLRNQLAAAEEYLQPQVNVKVARLLASDDPVRGTSTPVLTLGKTATTVLIQTPEPLPAGEYIVEIRQPTGEVVLPIQGLEPLTIGLSFFLPPAALEPGEYRIWLLRGSAEIYPKPFELRVPE